MSVVQVRAPKRKMDQMTDEPEIPVRTVLNPRPLDQIFKRKWEDHDSEVKNAEESNKRQKVSPVQPHRLYTSGEVRELIEEALRQQAQYISDEYEDALQQRMREQWEGFSIFNRDHLSKSSSNYMG